MCVCVVRESDLRGRTRCVSGGVQSYTLEYLCVSRGLSRIQFIYKVRVNYPHTQRAEQDSHQQDSQRHTLTSRVSSLLCLPAHINVQNMQTSRARHVDIEVAVCARALGKNQSLNKICAVAVSMRHIVADAECVCVWCAASVLDEQEDGGETTYSTQHVILRIGGE